MRQIGGTRKGHAVVHYPANDGVEHVISDICRSLKFSTYKTKFRNRHPTYGQHNNEVHPKGTPKVRILLNTEDKNHHLALKTRKSGS